MSFFKKNPLFCVVVALCVAASIAGVILATQASDKLGQAQRSLAGAESQLTTMLNADPVPTGVNLEAAERNLAELEATLEQIRQNLQQGSALRTSEDGVSVIAGIQQYISNLQRATATHTNEAGQPVPIETPNDFAFGFRQYLKEATVPEDSTKVALLDKQRQILSYLIRQLIEAGPQSIDAVRREVLEAPDSKGGDSFSIDPAVSARVPGAIDTMAFSITFSGYTDALREFLNGLAGFELPIVVRSIEVVRPSGSETVVAPERGRNDAGSIFDLFAEEEAPTETKSQLPAEAQKPVIEENISQFTVILEFIDVVLPEMQNQEVSDPV